MWFYTQAHSVKWRILTNWLGVIRKRIIFLWPKHDSFWKRKSGLKSKSFQKWFFSKGVCFENLLLLSPKRIPFQKQSKSDFFWKINNFKSDAFSKGITFWAQKWYLSLNTSWFKFPLTLFESKLLEFEVPNMRIEINGLLYH